MTPLVLEVALSLLLVCMTMCSLLVYCFPSYLQSISCHGKMNANRCNNESESSIISFDISTFYISKSNFKHMYIVGFLLCLTLQYYSCIDKLSSNHLLLSLFTAQTFRRLWESYNITMYGTSNMHVFGYLAGLLHYIIVPLAIYTTKSDAIHDHMMMHCPFYSHSLSNYSSSNSIMSNCRIFAALLLFTYSSYHQYKCHGILYNIKKKKEPYTSSNSQLQSSCSSSGSSSTYGLPRGDLFDYVCCPHYLTEILIYVSFILIHPTSIVLYCLLVWIASNLCIVAIQQHAWYTNNFQYSKSYPANWKIMIPYIW